MATQTSRKQVNAKDEEQEAPEPVRVHAHAWAAGNGPLQVPLAGLLADRPELASAELSHEEWNTALDKYLRSARPATPDTETE